ncbi:MAG: hypothetical protein OHK0017_03820 [Patescibacteria group bacterium]
MPDKEFRFKLFVISILVAIAAFLLVVTINLFQPFESDARIHTTNQYKENLTDGEKVKQFMNQYQK